MKNDAKSLAIHANEEITKIYEILKKVTERLTHIQKAILTPDGEAWLVEDAVTGRRDKVSIGQVVGTLIGIISGMTNPQVTNKRCECASCVESREAKQKTWN